MFLYGYKRVVNKTSTTKKELTFTINWVISRSCYNIDSYDLQLKINWWFIRSSVFSRIVTWFIFY